jgi:predicted Fe-Mo cluster-binding NifX family protein
MMIMKIAIPVVEQSINADVSQSFGRAPHLLIYNTVTKESYFLDNQTVASRGGAGVRVAEVVADHGAKVLLTQRCGKSVEEALRRTEVLAYKAVRGTAKENIEAFLNDKLSLLTEFHDGLHRVETH